jgi:hypothetical protein
MDPPAGGGQVSVLVPLFKSSTISRMPAVYDRKKDLIMLKVPLCGETRHHRAGTKILFLGGFQTTIIHTKREAFRCKISPKKHRPF